MSVLSVTLIIMSLMICQIVEIYQIKSGRISENDKDFLSQNSDKNTGDLIKTRIHRCLLGLSALAIVYFMKFSP